MDASLSFGRWLRQRRNLLDLTQAALAQQVGCSAVTIRKLEADARKPSVELARALGVVLRIPEREQAAFIQFARAQPHGARFQLPAWNPQQISWRSGQIPPHKPKPAPKPDSLTIEYNLVGQAPPAYTQAPDGRLVARIEATGVTGGDIEGEMRLMLTQIIQPKPEAFGYSQVLPMQLGAQFSITVGGEILDGIYTGMVAPVLDAAGNGEAHLQATGQVISVTSGFIDLFLNYIFVTDIVKMVEGEGTGATGQMQLKKVS